MRGRVLLVVGLAAGYIIGTRRGRQGFENLKERASDALDSPRVQSGIASAQKYVSENVPVVGDQVAAVIGKANDAAARATDPGITVTVDPKPAAADSDEDR